ncbi:unnamed protein product [Thlaspi arvense]|uniref:Uncharacterized protein n=1 Tax=Thlaspi arvense TaxID=13288 RepID=A0AAU9RG14_THLAR|nr:unnamed protein product [Thlaspi arvense]
MVLKPPNRPKCIQKLLHLSFYLARKLNRQGTKSDYPFLGCHGNRREIAYSCTGRGMAIAMTISKASTRERPEKFASVLKLPKGFNSGCLGSEITTLHLIILKTKADDDVRKGTIPAYLLDHETTMWAKVLSNTIKQKRKEKAGKWEVPLPKGRPVGEDEMFRVVKSGKRKSKHKEFSLMELRADTTALPGIA